MNIAERPNFIPWPPVIYVAAVIVAVALQLVLPLPWPVGPVQFALVAFGLFAIVAALVVEMSAVFTFRRYGTAINPTRGATSLVTSGPYYVSRNPIYLGNTTLMFGAGLVFGVWWLLAAALIAAWAVQRLAIEREEKHLASRFGKAWEDYAAKTPRWLLFR